MPSWPGCGHLCRIPTNKQTDVPLSHCFQVEQSEAVAHDNEGLRAELARVQGELSALAAQQEAAARQQKAAAAAAAAELAALQRRSAGLAALHEVKTFLHTV